MRSMLKIAITGALALASLGSVFASQARAGCGLPESPKVKPAAFAQPWDKEPEPEIVGFWNFSLVAKDSPGIPDSTPLDAGFSQWHRDGTEIMNSSKPPATSNFCLGIWEKVGEYKYKLNHFAISSDINGNLIGPTRITEEVTLSHDGQSYSGSFSIDNYDTKGNLLPTMGHVQGIVTAKRIHVHSTIQDVSLL
jgi:hypothetical protein